MWFDYEKVFDFVPHNWITITNTIKDHKCYPKTKKVRGTKITLRAKNETIKTWIIKYLTGLLQGDCLSLLRFILSVNSLLFLLKKLPGYKIGESGERGISISLVFC